MEDEGAMAQDLVELTERMTDTFLGGLHLSNTCFVTILAGVKACNLV